jgi:hypothetical protein
MNMWIATPSIIASSYGAAQALRKSRLKPSLLNSLIIHEEKTKKNYKRVASLYVIEISLDLHKLLL